MHYFNFADSESFSKAKAYLAKHNIFECEPDKLIGTRHGTQIILPPDTSNDHLFKVQRFLKHCPSTRQELCTA